ncbi:hypothetical protein ACVWXD_000962 [Pseudomonas sp. TE3911]
MSISLLASLAIPSNVVTEPVREVLLLDDLA